VSIRGIHTWEGTCTARWPYVIFYIEIAVLVALMIAAIVTGIGSLFISALAVGVSSLAILLFTKITVQAGPDGLTILYGPLNWPRQNFQLDDIEHATVIDDLNPWKWGGWGYRGTLRIFRRAAVNLRRGPAIRLDLTRKRVFVVTVDQPALGVNVLNQAIEMRPKRPGLDD